MIYKIVALSTNNFINISAAEEVAMSNTESVCQVRMRDRFNNIYATIKAVAGKRTYQVTNHRDDSGGVDTCYIAAKPDGNISCSCNVPIGRTLDGIVKRYSLSMKDGVYSTKDGQLSYSTSKGYTWRNWRSWSTIRPC